jgi:hypothetical protein
MPDISIYETRTLLEAVRRTMNAPSFLKDTFFTTIQTFITEHVDVDFQKEKRRVAPFVAPLAGGFNMDRQGYQTKTYVPPLIAPQRKLTVQDINKRSMGENIYSQQSPADRQAMRLAEDLVFFEKAITRREELMCRDILLTGKCVMNGYIDDQLKGTVSETVDYGFGQIVVLSGGDVWPASTSDPFANLKTWRQTVLQNSDRAPTICIMSSNLVETFVTHPKIVNILNRNILLGILSPVVNGQQQNSLSTSSISLGAYGDYLTFVGTIPGVGLEIYSYDAYYDDENGVTQPMIPDNTVILGKKNMGSIYYGAVTQMEMDGEFYTYEGQRIPKVWAEIGANARMIRESARPLPVPQVIEDWLVATVA